MSAGMSEKFAATFHGRDAGKRMSYKVRQAPIVELMKAAGLGKVGHAHTKLRSERP
jgi:hypothetical protein